MLPNSLLVTPEIMCPLFNIYDIYTPRDGKLANSITQNFKVDVTSRKLQVWF